MRLPRLVTLLVLYTVASATVLTIFVVRPGLSGHPRADFPHQLDGTAHRPYVTRPLVPATIRAVKAIVPDAIEAKVTAGMQDRRMIELLGWHRERLFDYALAIAVLLAYFVAFAFVLRALAAAFHPLPPVLADLAPLVGLLFLPLFFSYYSYLYDPGTLLTSALVVLALVRRRFAWVAAALALAALNKETSIVFLPVCAAYAKLEEGRLRWGRLAALLAIWIAVRAALGWSYADRPGGLFEWHLDHTRWLFNEWPGRFLLSIGYALVMGTFVAHRWREKNRFLKAGLGLTLVPLVGASFVFGFADELRGYYECFPFLYLLMLPSLLGPGVLGRGARDAM